MKYRKVSITNNVAKYPESQEDTEEFPELIEYIEDEEEHFIIDEENHFWYANEFFFQSNVEEFESEATGGICHMIMEKSIEF